MPSFFSTSVRISWTLAILCACAASPPRTLDTPGASAGTNLLLIEALKSEPAGGALPDPVSAEDSPLFRQAAALDRFLKGLSTPDEAKALRKECAKAKAKNVFCPIVRDFKKLQPFLVENERPFTFHPAPARVPVTPVFAEGAVTNYKALRKADVENLLPGFKALPAESLLVLKGAALRSTGCPDNAAIAVAATLEDSLPTQVNPKEIASLYARVGSCFPKSSANREHFLTRAGLLFYFAGDYTAAEKVLAKTPAEDALVGRPLYWLYRSRKALGDGPGAAKALKRLITQHPLSFHALMACLVSGQSPESVFLHAAVEPKKRSKRVPWANRWLEALEALKRFGFLQTTERLTFWVSARAQRLEPETRLYLADFGSPLFKVTRLTELFIRKPKLMATASMKNAYPLAYWPLMERNGIELDPLLLLSVGRKESKFDPKAVSPANAQGLLQIHPDTAARLTNGANVDLTNPYVNITIGAHYLTELLRRMEGKLPWVLASYNAGEDAARSWQTRFPHPDPVLQIDLITFRETRNYVGFVLSNYYWYRRLYQPEKPSPLDGLVLPEIAQK